MARKGKRILADGIAERTAIEKALHESEAKYRELVQNANSAIIRWKSDGTITFFNEYAQVFFGYDIDEVIGKNISIIVPEMESGGRDLTRLAYDIASHPENFVNTVNENICSNGRRTWMIWTHKPIFDQKGQVSEILAVGTDITKQKQAEEALKRLSQFPQENPNPVLRCTSDGVILYANPPAGNWLSMLGWQAGGLLPPPVYAAVVDAYGQDYAIEKEITNPAGRTLSLFAVQPPGEDYINLYGIDITNRKQAEEALREGEERYRNLFELSPDGIVIWQNDKAVLINQAAICTFGATSPDEILGKSIYEIHPFDYHDKLRARIQFIYETGATVAPTDYKFIQLDGRLIDVEATGTLINYQNHPAILSLYRDVSERRQAEEALKNAHDLLEQRVQERTVELNKRAEQLSRLSSELTLAEQRERKRLAEILHDHHQQLLVGARIGLQVLAQRTEPGLKPEAVQIIDLLTQAIETSRNLTAELSPPILSQAGLSAALEWLGRWMKEKHELDVELRVDARLDPDREDIKLLLFQSIRELLFNAVKHAEVKSALVEMDQKDDELCITVADRGVGFDIEGIWERIKNGTGFGLFSIRERLMLLGGSLEMESTPGEGSRFSLNIPFSVEVPAGSLQLDRTAVPESVPETDLFGETENKIRVMLVDDHAVMRQGLSTMLAIHYDIAVVAEAADGEEAVALVPEIDPDVILMDISMPKMNGIEATRIIHSRFPHIRIIGLSMFAAEEQAAIMIEAGAATFCCKSDDMAVLLAAIRGESEACAGKTLKISKKH